MKTIVLDAPETLRLIDTQAPPEPGRGEALVRVHRVGVCGTDLHSYRGRNPFLVYPRIMGHELGVEVVAIGSGVTALKIGDRCSVEPYLNCGRCVACRRGKSNCCAKLEVLGVHVDGGMREFIVLPAQKLHVANDLAYDQLALVETLGIGAHAVQRAGIERDAHTLIIGAGPIGLSALTFARLATKNLMALDVNAERLAFASEIFGLAHTFLTGPSTLDDVLAATDGELPTTVIDATGNAESMTRAFDYVAPGGTLVYVGWVQSDLAFSDPHLHRREISLLASRNALPDDFTRIIHHIRAGEVDTRPWITHRATAEETVAAFPTWLRPETGTIKAMLSF